MATDIYKQATHEKTVDEKTYQTTISLTNRHRQMIDEANLNLTKASRIGVEMCYASYLKQHQTQNA